MDFIAYLFFWGFPTVVLVGLIVLVVFLFKLVKERNKLK